MGKNSKYGSVGVIIRKDKDGGETYSEPKSNEEARGRVVNVIENTSDSPKHVQNVGRYTDVLMGPGSVLHITVEDEIRGVPNEIKGTGIVKKKYDPAKHDRPNPVTGGMPGMEPIDARESLPPDHAAQKLKRIEKRLGKKLAGWGTRDEVRAVAEEVKEIAAKEGVEIE